MDSFGNDFRKSIKDPAVHGEIIFTDALDQIAFALINAPEFQRLQRIRQVGLASVQYPNATHTRFIHSLGVYHTARTMLNVLRDRMTERGLVFDESRARAVALAALLHDIGHGPYSHAYERVQKMVRGKEAVHHEDWSAEIITGDTSIRAILASFDPSLPQEIADILAADEPADIYCSIVSSQFDADRFDYIQRDIAGTNTGLHRFNPAALMQSLDIANIVPGKYNPGAARVPALIVNHSGLDHAVNYLTARYEVYRNVAYHKATRAAEQMLVLLLKNISRALETQTAESLGLDGRDPFVRGLNPKAEPLSLSDYLRLDDNRVATLINQIVDHCPDSNLVTLAQRFLDRKLFYCVDAGQDIADLHMDGEARVIIGRFKQRLAEDGPGLGLEYDVTMYDDDPMINGYSWYDWDNQAVLKKMLVRMPDDSVMDIANVSPKIAELKKQRFYRIYTPGKEAHEFVNRLWEETLEEFGVKPKPKPPAAPLFKPDSFQP